MDDPNVSKSIYELAGRVRLLESQINRLELTISSLIAELSKSDTDKTEPIVLEVTINGVNKVITDPVLIKQIRESA